MAGQDKPKQDNNKQDKPTIHYEPTQPEIVHEPVRRARTGRVFCKMGG